MLKILDENKGNNIGLNILHKQLQVDMMKTHGDEMKQFIPNKENFGKRLRERRNKVLGIPPPAKSPEELKTIPVHLTKTSEGEEWLRLNVDSESGKGRILIFMSEFGKKMLVEAAIWLCDGTFEVVSKIGMFSQLFAIVVPAPNSGVGCVALIALLPLKSMVDYKTVFDVVRRIQEIPPPAQIYCDFGVGILSAVNEVLGCNIR